MNILYFYEIMQIYCSKKVPLKMLPPHAEFFLSFLNRQYTEIYKFVANEHKRSYFCSVTCYRLSSSFSMWSKSRCV